MLKKSAPLWITNNYNWSLVFEITICFAKFKFEEELLMLRLCLRYLLGLLVILFAVVPQAFAEKDTLIYSWSSNVGELNPHMYSPNQMFAQAMVYESLVKYGEGNKVLPWLAEKWTISPDGKIYTFELRKDVTFTDGTPFNAEAV